MEELLKLWPMVVGLILVVVWIVRLEAKVNYLGKGIEKEDKAVWKKIDSLSKSITEILASVGRIEGRLMKNGGK